MLQRIQTLFLICTFVAALACFFLPFWNYTGVNPDYIYQLTLFKVKLISGNSQLLAIGTLPIIVLNSVSILLSVVSLFFYKKRIMQMKINNYNLLITLIFTVTVFLWIPYMISEALPGAVSQWQPGLIFPLLSVIFLVLANIFIRKDEKLVKSADRLR